MSQGTPERPDWEEATPGMKPEEVDAEIRYPVAASRRQRDTDVHNEVESRMAEADPCERQEPMSKP